MTQDQNEKPVKKTNKDRLAELIHTEKDSHTNRKVKRAISKRIERLDSRAIFEFEEEPIE